MNWFDRLFPVFMIAHPLFFALFIKTKQTSAPVPELQRLMRRLMIATGLALLLHLGVQMALEATHPERDLIRAAWPSLVGTLGCILMWSLFAGPAMAAKNAAWGNTAGTTTRSASLVPRHLADPISARAWGFGWALFGVCALVTSWSISAGAPAVLVLGLGWWVGMAVFGAKQNLLEAEPRNESGSDAVDESYRSLRAFRSWSFYWLGLVGTVAFTFTATMVLLWPATSGMIGAILGTSLGGAGAIFGVMASLRRVRINELLLKARQDLPT
jgi:hypothetical protein